MIDLTECAIESHACTSHRRGGQLLLKIACMKHAYTSSTDCINMASVQSCAVVAASIFLPSTDRNVGKIEMGLSFFAKVGNTILGC